LNEQSSIRTETKPYYPRFSQKEFDRRRALVRKLMERSGLDSLLLYSRGPTDGSVNYLSNFVSAVPAFLIFPLEGEPTLFVHFHNHIPYAKAISVVSDIQWDRHDAASCLARALGERNGSGRIGVVGLSGVPNGDVAGILRRLPRAKLVDLSEEYAWIRWVRSEEEVDWFKKAAHLSDLAAEALEKKIRPGLNGHDLSVICYDAVVSEGGKFWNEPLTGSTSMADPAIFVPWQQSIPRVIKKGDVVITEIAPSYAGGYTAQIHRPYAVSTEPTGLYHELFDVALECFKRVSTALRPGATTDDVLDATSVIEERGFTVYDSLLHQEGGANPELGSRSSAHNKQQFTFKENMVYIIQPQPVTRDLKAGLQLGATVLIKAGGAVNLNKYPFQFPVCGLG